MFQTLFWIAIILNPNSIQSICCFDSIPKGKNTCCVFKLAFLLAHQANTKNKKKNQLEECKNLETQLTFLPGCTTNTGKLTTNNGAYSFGCTLALDPAIIFNY